MTPEGLKEIINTLFEGVISLTVIGGAGYIAATHSDSVALVGLASTAGIAVITFWFGQRATTKAVNGNITALANIAGQMVSSQQQAAATTATTATQIVAAAKEAAK